MSHYRNSPESPNRLPGYGCSSIQGDKVAELFQASHIMAGEAVGRQATAVVRPEIMVRHTIPHDGERSIPGGGLKRSCTLRDAQHTKPSPVPPSIYQLRIVLRGMTLQQPGGHRDGEAPSDGYRRHHDPESADLSFVPTDLTTGASPQDVSSAPTWASGRRHTSPWG